MTRQASTWQEVRRIADEVELEIHLAGMEARDRWRELQPRLAEIEKTIASAGERAGNAVEREIASIGTALHRLLEQARAGARPGIQKSIALPFDAVLAKLPDALKTEGFGILTQIDVRDTLREKLGVEFRRYKILGACNPALAHRALQTDLAIGVMLPCNVVVYEDKDRTVVTAIDPMETIAARSETLRPIAEEVRAKLARVLEVLSA